MQYHTINRKIKEIVYNTGKAFGNFQRLLGNYPMSKLEETIKDFHDTKKRYDKLMDDIKIDSEGRVAEVANEIVFILMREDICIINNGRLRYRRNTISCNT